ncbi:hypothetical protein [Tepidanaerobacter acetatoxydans]|uniref:hypothetical protein n=1 Tax=Tepidanaerobacter acetatoxydans TaxID=499229 RepID=UPI001BD5C7E8|nr:hypothetical protein [Tepidanaerobacter acetatoxydans]
MAEKVLSEDIRGMGIASVSQILHCIKPYVFPILNDADDAGIAAYKKIGLNLNKPGDITHYIENIRLIKKFRDENCNFKNYRIFDTIFWSYSEDDIAQYAESIDITKEQWVEMLIDPDVFRPWDIELVLKIYDMGGQATATELAKKDSRHPSSYNFPVVDLAKRIHNYTNCTVPKRGDGKKRWWHIPFNGSYTDNGHYTLRKSNFSETKSLISSNLYQIFAYVKNTDYDGDVSGMLLYPTVDYELDQMYKMSGNKIYVKTVNLGDEFQNIENRLLDIIKVSGTHLYTY